MITLKTALSAPRRKAGKGNFMEGCQGQRGKVIFSWELSEIQPVEVTVIWMGFWIVMVGAHIEKSVLYSRSIKV